LITLSDGVNKYKAGVSSHGLKGSTAQSRDLDSNEDLGKLRSLLQRRHIWRITCMTAGHGGLTQLPTARLIWWPWSPLYREPRSGQTGFECFDAPLNDGDTKHLLRRWGRWLYRYPFLEQVAARISALKARKRRFSGPFFFIRAVLTMVNCRFSPQSCEFALSCPPVAVHSGADLTQDGPAGSKRITAIMGIENRRVGSPKSYSNRR